MNSSSQLSTTSEKQYTVVRYSLEYSSGVGWLICTDAEECVVFCVHPA